MVYPDFMVLIFFTDIVPYSKEMICSNLEKSGLIVMDYVVKKKHLLERDI